MRWFVAAVVSPVIFASAAAAAADTTTIVSVSSTGGQANGDSWFMSTSRDGRYVAFESEASNLVTGDRNNASDVFVRDLVSGRTRLVSVRGSRQRNADSSQPSISADGRYVAFKSEASNLVPGDNNHVIDVFVCDLITGRTRRVSVSSTGEQGIDDSVTPSISSDGRYVAFASEASNLVPGDTNGTFDVFIRDLVGGRTRLVSVSSTGEPGNEEGSGHPSISADGRYVAFSSDASNLVRGDRNNHEDVFIRDLVGERTRLVSVSSTGEPGNEDSDFPSISGDGRYVAFSSPADNLVPGDRFYTEDVFIRDLVSGRTRLVSVSRSGEWGNFDSGSPSISGDGRYVAFSSPADNLVPGDRYYTEDVFIRDLVSGRTRLVSVSRSGEWGNGDSDFPSISGDGRYVAFYSSASNLVRGDRNDHQDVFVRDR